MHRSASFSSSPSNFSPRVSTSTGRASRPARGRNHPSYRVLAIALAGFPLAAWAQSPPEDIARERAEFASWLKEAPTSPYRALVQHPIGRSTTLGPPEADVPLSGLGLTTIAERGGGLSLTGDGGARPLARDRVVTLGSYHLLATGLPGGAVVTVYGAAAGGHPVVAPSYYPYLKAWRSTVALSPVTKPSVQRILGPDGSEVEATEAGSVAVMVDGRPVSLRVFRIPAPGGEESEPEIYFRDGTNGKGSYPAGRFVNLLPAPDGRYVLDLNRARNPFCAYNTVYPCPAPWRGNTIPAPVAAGERYPGDGLGKPPA